MSGPREDRDVFSMSSLREGEELALNEIMDRWQRRLTSYLIRLTGSEALRLISRRRRSFVSPKPRPLPSNWSVFNMALRHRFESGAASHPLEDAAPVPFDRCIFGGASCHDGNSSGL
jgi:hypothetical protein